MKKEFPGYYRPTDAEFQELWSSAVFAVDASVLLNIYGYSRKTREIILSLLEFLGDRIWIPHQFAAEYHKNRAKAILEQASNYRTVTKTIRSILDEQIKPAHRHPFVSTRSVLALEHVCDELGRGLQAHETLLNQDPYFTRISELFADRVGPAPAVEDLPKLHEYVRKRYATKMPPGYSDAAKPEPDCFGDALGWGQILQFGGERKASLFFLTDDMKEDWWHLQNDRRIGPRPELVAEYRASSGRLFHMYTLEEFMARARDHLGRRVAPAALQEIRRRTEASASTRTSNKALASAALGAKATRSEVDPGASEPLKPTVETPESDIDSSRKKRG